MARLAVRPEALSVCQPVRLRPFWARTQALSNLLWGYARLGVRPEALLLAATEALPPMLPTFGAVTFAGLMWCVLGFGLSGLSTLAGASHSMLDKLWVECGM
jgi:hypothetical protein